MWPKSANENEYWSKVQTSPPPLFFIVIDGIHLMIDIAILFMYSTLEVLHAHVKMVIDPKNHPCPPFHILEMVEILSRKARQVPSSPTPHLHVYLEIGLWSHPHKWQCALCYCHWDFIFWDLITAYQNMLDLNVSIEDCPFWKTISTQFELSVLVLTLFHH